MGLRQLCKLFMRVRFSHPPPKITCISQQYLYPFRQVGLRHWILIPAFRGSNPRRGAKKTVVKIQQKL